MKKILLTLVLAVASVFGSYAMTLKEAFGALSDIQNISVRAADYNLPVISDVIADGQIAAAYNLPAEKILATGNAAYAILNQVPLADMINGANNNLAAAFVYATSNGDGTNDILIAVMSGYRGAVVFLYGTVSDAARLAIQSAPLEMEGAFLSLKAAIPGEGDFNIILSKAR